MPASTAIAASAAAATKPAAPAPVTPGGEGAGDLFAVLVGMVGDDKAAQPQLFTLLINGILGGNVLRALREAEQVARDWGTGADH